MTTDNDRAQQRIFANDDRKIGKHLSVEFQHRRLALGHLTVTEDFLELLGDEVLFDDVHFR